MKTRRISKNMIKSKLCLAFLLLWFIPFASYSQRYISGRITDAADGSPIPAVTVFLTNTTIGIVTDAEGYYQLSIPREGSYRLAVSHVGYQSVEQDIEPGRASVQLDIAMRIQELDEIDVSAGIRFRQRDINLFWSKILGKNPSGRTIQAMNPEIVYFYYNPETRILKVTCREPLEIINYETGYHILYMLTYFTHDYNTDITNWEYQSIFTELEPNTIRQKKTWENNRKEVYQVSIPKFIKSLYHNTLMNDGFVLTPLHVSVQNDARRGMSDRFGQSALINPDDILSTQSAGYGKILNLDDKQIMLVCYGKPVTNYDVANLPSVRSGGRRWEQDNKGIFRNILHGDIIRIFPDGTYTNRLFLSSMDLLNPLLMGLCMSLPIDYLPETEKSDENPYSFEYDFDDINEQFDKQLSVYPQEKLHLHTDRDLYVPGEKIWFKAYLTDATTHQPQTFSQYVYVELISSNDSLVNRVMVRPNDEMFYGHLPIAEVIPEGNYTLRAYTRQMENLGDDYFFKKNIRIGNPTSPQPSPKERERTGRDDFDVSFFPEGGNLVEGVLCKVAFKALNINGQSVIISGKLIDDEGIEITDVKTRYAGMGVFVYTPLPGKKYCLKCRNENGLEKQFELPQTNLRTYTLTASPRNSNLFVEVKRSANAPPDMPLYLLAHCRGMVLHFEAWENDRKAIVFEQEQFPAGVIQFVLFDGQMNPLSERLVFSKNYDEVKIGFHTDKASYEKREKVITTLNLSPSLLERVGVRSHFSVAITDDKDLPVDESTTILSSLLLSSELKGYIENPAYYLQDNPASTAALDLLMMTHGWRRYNVPEIVKGNPEYPKTPFQESMEISGSVKSRVLSRPVTDSEILIISEECGVEVTSTDEKGLFVFQDLEFPDSTTFFVQALNSRGSDNVQIAVNDEPFPVLVYALQSHHLTPALSKGEGGIEEEMKYEPDSNSFIVKAEQRSRYDEDIKVIMLDEVEITAPRIEKKEEARMRFWANEISNITIRREEIEKYHFSGQTVEDFLAMLVPGVLERQIGESKKISIRGASISPLVLVDGFEREGLNISTNEIESIDVFKGSNAVAFGMRGAYGVISITTRRGANSSLIEKTNFAVYTPLGYQKPVEFYAPKYETLEAKHLTIPDYRTTIFWKPDIVIADSGETAFDFYTSDFPTTYSVVIEGLTIDGQIVRQVEKIRVK